MASVESWRNSRSAVFHGDVIRFCIPASLLCSSAWQKWCFEGSKSQTASFCTLSKPPKKKGTTGILSLIGVQFPSQNFKCFKISPPPLALRTPAVQPGQHPKSVPTAHEALGQWEDIPLKSQKMSQNRISFSSITSNLWQIAVSSWLLTQHILPLYCDSEPNLSGWRGTSAVANASTPPLPSFWGFEF